jgi:hypothetical protein
MTIRDSQNSQNLCKTASDYRVTIPLSDLCHFFRILHLTGLALENEYLQPVSIWLSFDG